MPEWAEHLRQRLAGLRLSPAREIEIVEELAQHLDQRYEELRAAGVSDAEASRVALDELCDPELLPRLMRPLRQANTPAPIAPGAPRTRLAADLWQDLRHAVRLLRKQPGFAAAATLTLALGIGASTAIFSLVDAALLRPLPFPDPDRLVAIWAESPRWRAQGFPYLPPANADVAAWRDHSASFANVAAIAPRTADLAGRGEAERVGAAGVTAGFFETLGVTPILGRTLTKEEELYGGPPVALIGHGLWQRRFGADPAVIGQRIAIGGEMSTIIGVLPPGFDFPRGAEWPAFFPFSGRTEVWVPLAFRAQEDNSGFSNWQSRQERGLVVVGRVKPTMTVGQAQAEVSAFAAREAREQPATHKDMALTLVPLRDQMGGPSSTLLPMLIGAVGLLQLIACVNVANLLLARGVGRQQEMAVRVALGARRGRLLRQLLAECLLLSAVASALGLALARAGVALFQRLYPIAHSRLNDASLDLSTLIFAAGLTIATSVVFGLVPAFRSTRVDLRSSLRDGARHTDASGRDRLRAILVATEVALAVVLLATAGLTVRSFLRVLAVHPGFRAESVAVFDLQAPASRYRDERSQIQLFRDVAARLESLPGVQAAGAITYLPLGGGQNLGSFTIEGDPPPAPGRQTSAERRMITTGYFAAMGIPIRRGRGFSVDDTLDHPRVVVINDTFARRHFAGRDPIGQRLRAGGALRTIVGVVADVRSSSLEGDVNAQFYIPHAQWGWASMTVVARVEGDPVAAASAMRTAVSAVDPQLVAANQRTMDAVVEQASSARRFTMALLAGFALAALLLTAIGIYGVVAFLAGRRRHEIGVRVALGAHRADIVRLVIGQGMKPVVAGAVAGLAGSLLAARLIASQLYGVSSADPLTLIAILVLLAAAALLACWLPAHRATRVHPLDALRDS